MKQYLKIFERNCTIKFLYQINLPFSSKDNKIIFPYLWSSGNIPTMIFWVFSKYTIKSFSKNYMMKNNNCLYINTAKYNNKYMPFWREVTRNKRKINFSFYDNIISDAT